MEGIVDGSGEPPTTGLDVGENVCDTVVGLPVSSPLVGDAVGLFVGDAVGPPSFVGANVGSCAVVGLPVSPPPIGDAVGLFVGDDVGPPPFVGTNVGSCAVVGLPVLPPGIPMFEGTLVESLAVGN